MDKVRHKFLNFIKKLEAAQNPTSSTRYKAIKEFCSPYLDKNKNIKEFNEELTNEGFLGSILGGLTRFALGSSIGKIIANVLGIERGVIYDLLTSRLVGAALGAALGKRI